jgi:uncharacterized Tic20 family protein
MSDTPPPPPAAAPQPLGDAEAQSQAKLTHVVNGIFPLLGGLIFWLIYKDRSEFMDDQGKEATNFGINIFIGFIILNIVNLVLNAIIPFWFAIGWLLWLGLWGFSIYSGIQAGNRAGVGERYRYPILPLRLIK